MQVLYGLIGISIGCGLLWFIILPLMEYYMDPYNKRNKNNK